MLKKLANIFLIFTLVKVAYDNLSINLDSIGLKDVQFDFVLKSKGILTSYDYFMANKYMLIFILLVVWLINRLDNR